jgi:hypothetical protein
MGKIYLKSRTAVIVAAFLAVGALSFFLGRSFSRVVSPEVSNISLSPSGTFLASQRETLDALDRYMKSCDASDRKTVEEATKEAEIMATRLYRSFWTYCKRGEEHEVWTSALRDLMNNPHLTLPVLKPILKEDPDSWNKGTLLQEGQDIILNLCAQVASIERDGYAHNMLQELAQEGSLPCSLHAKRLLEFIDSGENLRAKSNGYKGTKSWKDLKWLKDNVLCPGMDKEEIQELLGEADFSSGAFVAYRGGNSQTMKTCLWLYFVDSFLRRCDWGSTPPEALPEMQRQLETGV